MEGIAALKKYELHPKLSKDPKKQQYLIDIYYSETSMNNFKTSVITQVDKLNAKMAQVEKDFESYLKVQARVIAKDTAELSQLKARFEGELKESKDVLI